MCAWQVAWEPHPRGCPMKMLWKGSCVASCAAIAHVACRQSGHVPRAPLACSMSPSKPWTYGLVRYEASVYVISWGARHGAASGRGEGQGVRIAPKAKGRSKGGHGVCACVRSWARVPRRPWDAQLPLTRYAGEDSPLRTTILVGVICAMLTGTVLPFCGARYKAQ